MMNIITNTPITSIDDDELAAVMAAVRCVLQQETDVVEAAVLPRTWRAAAMLESQGLPPTRNGQYSSWAQVERAPRERRWCKGIVGL